MSTKSYDNEFLVYLLLNIFTILQCNVQNDDLLVSEKFQLFFRIANLDFLKTFS